MGFFSAFVYAATLFLMKKCAANFKWGITAPKTTHGTPRHNNLELLQQTSGDNF